MPTDRLQGFNAGVSVKAAAAVATTGANISLTGAQTIDGVSIGSGERILVKDQTTASENGIYISDSSTWIRSKDCNGARDLIPGSWVYVDRGTNNGTKFYVFNSSSTDTEIDIDTDDITISDITPSLTGASSYSNSLLALASGTAWRSSDGLWLDTGATEPIALAATNTWTAINQFEDGFTIYSSDGTTGEGPGLDIYRQSTTPADNDPAGTIRFKGDNSTATKTTIGKLAAVWDDVTQATEDAHYNLDTVQGGTLATRLSIGAGVYTAGATDPGAGAFNSSLEYQVRGKSIEWQTTDVIDLTSSNPTAVTLLGSLSTDVSEIEVHLAGASISQATAMAIKIGDSGGIESSGYGGLGYSLVDATTDQFRATVLSTGFLLGDQGTQAAANTFYGTVKLIHLGSNVWSADIDTVTTGSMHGGQGTKTLSGPLDRVEITTIANVSTFDSGSAYMRYR
jgi:hypothetical protein